MVRLCLPQHLILDSRAQVDNKANYNLSLARTLPALQALADGQDLSSMEHAALCRVRRTPGRFQSGWSTCG